MSTSTLKSKSKSKSESETKLKSETRCKTKVKSEAKIKTKSKTKADAEAKPQLELEPTLIPEPTPLKKEAENINENVISGEAIKKCLKLISSVKKDMDSDAVEPERIQTLMSFVTPRLLSYTEASKKDATAMKRANKVTKEFCEVLLKCVEKAEGLVEDVLVDLLRNITNHLVFLKDFPVLRKKLARSVIIIWTSWSTDGARIAALLFLHALCRKYSSLLDTCMKEMYQGYEKACRSLTGHNLGQASLLLNGLAEIFSLNQTKSVEHGTRYLKQLANLVQRAIKHPQVENTKKIVCWQFISLVRFWAHLLAEQPAGSKLQALQFPFAGLLNCLFTFQLSPRYFPFQFHCAAASIELIEKKECFISIAPCMLRMIAHVAKQPLYKLETKKSAYDLVIVNRVPKSEAVTKNYLETVAEEAIYYLLKYLCTLDILNFPEHANSIINMLNSMLKVDSSNIDRKFKKQFEAHTSKLIQQKKLVEAFRCKEALTPSASLGKKIIPSSEVIIIKSYLESIEKVRYMKRKLLADNGDETDEEDEDDGKDDDKDEDEEDGEDKEEDEDEDEDDDEEDGEDEEKDSKEDEDKKESVSRSSNRKGKDSDTKKTITATLKSLKKRKPVNSVDMAEPQSSKRAKKSKSTTTTTTATTTHTQALDDEDIIEDFILDD